MSDCPDVITRLIERFDQQLDQVRSPDYNETQLRIDFVNPMFRQLGWDIDNTQGFAEQYREVVHEDRVLVAGANKAPDYSFRIGGVRKYFVETKKPFVNIKDNWEPAYQLRRYGWSAKLAVSILTDFEELAVYDCRVTPKQLDKASTARRDFISYRDYCDRWDFIEGTFSKQAVLRGDFDRYCQTKKGRGAQEFDDAFLEEIEQWRQKLASNLALRNDRLDERALNFAVQRIIDRIIFLRICEDRGTEHPQQLLALLSGEKVYARLQKLFRDADARYNSGLFHFRREAGRDEEPDELTPGLEVDDATLKGIIRRLYYPDSPYEFTMVSADILGSVYERFLGKVIRKTDHRAKVEEKPEVRKAGGVYYTPAYIVDYIVKQTVGKLLGPPTPAPSPGTPPSSPSPGTPAPSPSPGMPGEGRGEGRSLTPKEASKLKILDPACGSGSFLIGAYQHLLDWHLQWYVSDGADKWSKGKTATLRPADRPSMAALIQTEEAGAIPNPAAGHWALTIKERKRILLDNIHGVDIDYQAVEVTKLALLLKVLEGETMESLGGLWTLFRERALPDLGHNIQCGNSLIGTDIMATDAWRQMSEDERDRVNPFDFEAAFPNVVAQGGFNAVIGNPPYIRMEQFVPLKEYLAATYKAHEERADLYAYFLERALNLLTKAGRVGQIVSNKFIRAKYGRPLRAVIADSSDVLTVADFAGADVFRAATVRTVVLVMSPKTRNAAPKAQYIPVPPPGIIEELRSRRTTLDHYAATRSVTLPANAFEPNEWKLTSEKNSGLLLKLRAVGVPLHKAIGGRALFGVKTGFNDAFIIDKETARRIDRQMQVTKPILFGRDIRRYSAVHTGRFVIYLHPNRRLDDFPGVKRHVIE